MTDRSRSIKLNASDIIEDITSLHNFKKYKEYDTSIMKLDEIVDDIDELNRREKEKEN